jgi:hypothetical protein
MMIRYYHRRNVRLGSASRAWKERSMSDTVIVLHTAIAIIAIVLLILVVRVDPVISLI